MGLTEHTAARTSGAATAEPHSPLPFVSVVMPVRNERAYIERSLGAVLTQDYPTDLLEIVVADGMSTDGTREILQGVSEGNSRVRLLDNPKQTAPCALNLATAASKGEIVIRVDGHCEVAHDYVSRCVRHLLEDGVDGVGGSLVTVGENGQAKAIAAAMSSSFGVGGAAFRTARDITILADTVPFPAYTRKIIEAAGPYDEQFTKNQDDEYNYRIRKIGGKLLLAADVHSRYYSRANLRSLARQYYGYGLFKPQVFWKHPRQMKLRQFVPGAFVACLAAGIFLAPFSQVARRSLLAILAAYASASGLASVRTAAQTEWRYLPTLPAAFAALHVSYGCGFLVGLAKVLAFPMPVPEQRPGEDE
jgi:succinoglycan biosynthesis protein ExoA